MASGRMSVVGMALLGVLAARGTHTADPAVDVDVIVPAERNGVQWELLDSAGGTAAVDLPNVVGFGHSDKDLVFVTSGPDANAVSTFDRHSFKAEAQVTLQQVSPAAQMVGPTGTAVLVDGAAYFLAIPTESDRRFAMVKCDLKSGKETRIPIDGDVYRAGDQFLLAQGKKLTPLSLAKGEFGAAIPLKEEIERESQLVMLPSSGVMACDAGGKIRRVADDVLKPVDDAGDWDTGRQLVQAFVVKAGGADCILGLSVAAGGWTWPPPETCSLVLLDPKARKELYRQTLDFSANAQAILSNDGQSLLIADVKNDAIIRLEIGTGKKTAQAALPADLSESQKQNVRLIAEALPK